jgi:hypothetical protein
MKLSILYHLESESARQVDEMVTDLKRRDSNYKIEKISLETLEGAQMAELYGIVEYPALLVIKDDGELYKGWEGTSLPLIDDIVYHLRN